MGNSANQAGKKSEPIPKSSVICDRDIYYKNKWQAGMVQWVKYPIYLNMIYDKLQFKCNDDSPWITYNCYSSPSMHWPPKYDTVYYVLHCENLIDKTVRFAPLHSHTVEMIKSQNIKLPFFGSYQSTDAFQSFFWYSKQRHKSYLIIFNHF